MDVWVAEAAEFFDTLVALQTLSRELKPGETRAKLASTWLSQVHAVSSTAIPASVVQAMKDHAADSDGPAPRGPPLALGPAVGAVTAATCTKAAKAAAASAPTAACAAPTKAVKSRVAVAFAKPAASNKRR